MKEIANPRHGILTLSGYALRVAVERGHLVVEDGVGANRRTGRFARADREVRRLIVLGHSGTISFEALRWLTDVGAGFAQIDNDGNVIAAIGPGGARDPELRRAQALATENGVGLAISKKLIREKLERQRSLAEKLPGGSQAHDGISQAIHTIAGTESIDQLRLAEADGAAAYWGAWSKVEVRFVPRDAKKLPKRWLHFGRRTSPLTASPRKSVNPANAILNYLYALIEAEARLAALAVGLDPILGVMHADLKSRDSLAADLMEPVRPLVDAWALRLLDQTLFRRRDFFETREGVCRIMPPTTQALSETLPQWAPALAPVAELVARDLLSGDTRKERRKKRRPPPTPLTQTNRSTSRPARLSKLPRSAGELEPGLKLGCEICGADCGGSGRSRCDACRAEHDARALERASSELRRRRQRGKDPAHGGEAAVKRGAKNTAHSKAAAAWALEHEEAADPEAFQREILPKLQGVRLGALTAVTGLSKPYCSLIRQGRRIPHPRHWSNLQSLIDERS